MNRRRNDGKAGTYIISYSALGRFTTDQPLAACRAETRSSTVAHATSAATSLGDGKRGATTSRKTFQLKSSKEGRKNQVPPRDQLDYLNVMNRKTSFVTHTSRGVSEQVARTSRLQFLQTLGINICESASRRTISVAVSVEYGCTSCVRADLTGQIYVTDATFILSCNGDDDYFIEYYNRPLHWESDAAQLYILCRSATPANLCVTVYILVVPSS